MNLEPDLSEMGPHSSKIAEAPIKLPSFRGIRQANVLVTGASGFLGKVWLGMLLERGPTPKRLTLLLRARRGESARQRFDHMLLHSPALRPLREHLGNGLWDFVDRHVRVVEGDASAPDFGLSPIEYARLASETDAVVHFAGLTDFEPDPLQAMNTNIWGAVYAARFAARTRGRRLMHVSTAYVAGAGAGLVKEELATHQDPKGQELDAREELALMEQELGKRSTRSSRIEWARNRAEALGWPNIYTYTKGLAERLVDLEPGVQSTIVRPSIVESSLSYPFPGWNEGINTSAPLVWLLATAFRRFPSRPEHRFDVIPVDFVALGSIAILARMMENRAEPVYHLASSDRHPLHFDRAIDLTALSVRRMHGKASSPLWKKQIIRHLDAIPVREPKRQFLHVSDWKAIAERSRSLLGKVKLKRVFRQSPAPRLVERLDETIKSWRSELRSTERRMGRIEDMLRLYRPFIFLYNYRFQTGNIESLFADLREEGLGEFSYELRDINWRDYWLDVHVPGLEVWSLPLMEGRRPPEDNPAIAPRKIPAPSLSSEGTQSRSSALSI